MGVVKSNIEIAAIERALHVTAGAFTCVEEILRVSVVTGDFIIYNNQILTSEYLHEVVALYLHEASFVMPHGLIISSGIDAAGPHHPGAGPIIPHTAIVVDIFPQDTQSGLYADITRTYVKGVVSAEVRLMYKTVAAAHKAALQSLRAGVAAHEPYDVACQVIIAAGYQVDKTAGFVHSLGHGLGNDVHEAPRLGAGDTTLLESGMVVTIEPGLYYPHLGGVRIEDTVLITESGYRNLTCVPHNWHIA